MSSFDCFRCKSKLILEMWKRYILIWLAAQTTILAQPATIDGIREVRQLNFDEWCPCLNSERNNKDHDVLDSMEGAATAGACPCLSAPDSESSPSIFTPALRVMEPFIRSAKEKTPKPLLNPEVGLASSVLETLQEVTDQEYQEALERDAARSALRDVEQNLLEQEIANNPQRNIVNIILQPKGDYSDDVMMSEASHIQETRCIHSPLGKTKNFKEKKFKPSKMSLREYFPLSNAPSGPRYYDMTNSASNVQERVALPARGNILEDLKLRSDMLKLKLFPNSKNTLKDAYTDIDMPNEFSRQSDYDNFNNMHAYRIPDYKLNTNVLKETNQKNLIPSSPFTKELDNYQGNDFISSPSHIEKYNAKNSERQPDNIQLDTKMVKLSKVPYSIENPTDDELFKTSKYVTSDLSKLQSATPMKSENDLIINSDPVGNNNNLIEFNQDKEFKYEKDNNNVDNADVISSPSELNAVYHSLNENKGGIDLKKECEIFNSNNMPIYKDETNSNVIETLIEETTPKTFRETTNNENNQMLNEDIKVDDLKNNEESSSNFKDLETGASNDNLEKTGILQQDNDQNSFDPCNKPNESENQVTNADNSLSTTTEEVVTASPNIKANIIKTFENVKKVNEKIQAKIKSNIENALRPNAIRNNPQSKLETTSLGTPVNSEKDVTEENVNTGNSVTTQDLQNIADNILNLSLSNKEATEPLAFESKTITNTNTNLQDTDNSTPRSELSNNEVSTISSLQITQPEPTLSGSSFRNFDEIVNVVDKESDKTRANDNKEVFDSLSTKNPCENIEPKNEDYTEVSSRNAQEGEMISEASSPFVNSIPHTNNFGQPNGNSNVRNFLDNVKTSISDMFNINDDIIGSRKSDNDYDNSYRTPTFLNGQDYFYKQPSNTPRNNINSYRAKVATPDTLSMNTIPSLIHKGNSDARSANEILRNPIEVPSVFKFDNLNGNYDSRFNTQTPRLNSFSENLKSRTGNTLKNVQDSFDDLQKLNLKNQDNKLGESLTKPNIFRASQPTNLSKRLQDINSDLMDRLSLMAQRIQSSQAKNKINNGIKSKPKFKPQIKENVKNRQQSGLRPNKQQSTVSSTRTGISKPYLQQNTRVLSQSREPNLKSIQYPSKSKNALESNYPLTKNLKSKPLKENKVTFSFTTTSIRPDILNPKTKSNIFNKPTPGTMRSSIDLPKSPSSLTSPLQKKLKPLSKLRPNDSKTLASERVTPSIALPDRMFDNFKTTYLNDPVNHETEGVANQRSNGFISQNIPEERSPENILSKIRNAVKAKTPNNSMSTKYLGSSIGEVKSNSITDATQSASNNINTAVSNVADKPLRQNVSYKCKMVCVEDKLDSK